MSGRQTAGAACEDRVDIIPREQSAPVATADRCLVVVAREHGRHAGEDPCLGVADGIEVLGILEIVEIRGIVLSAAGPSGNQLCKLAAEGYLRWLCAMQQRQFVEHIRQPLRLLLPVDVEAPDGVLQRFVAHIDLRSQRLFGQMHHRTAQREVFGEVVLPVESEHRLALHAVTGIILERDADISASIDDALVEYGHLAGRIVDRVVAAFL